MAVTAGLALATLGACTAAGPSADTASDPKSVAAGGQTTVSPLPPGKYKTLPQPCTAVDMDTLKGLVPGAKDYAGTESLTYDTDRRVGCSWHTDTTTGETRSLSVDFERAVSYDPNVSDEVQAETDFDRRAANASIPPVEPGSTPTTPASPTATPTGTDASSGQSAGTGSGGNSPDLASRRLTDLGDGAFIDDVLKTPANGPKRSVSVVFRMANVVVSVTYAVSEPRGAAPATSADLQKDAREVAAQLAHKVER
jgi:hypothetical protein